MEVKKMRKGQKNDLKFCHILLTKPIVYISPGAFAGNLFKTKKMVDICEIGLENLFVNITSR
jgi:hypothetical protein